MMKLVYGNKALPFYIEKEAYEGVRRIAEKVCEDIRNVGGISPEIKTCQNLSEIEGVLVATCGHSPLLESLEKEGLFRASDIKHLREVYRLQIIRIAEKEILLIAGSDKRGTIYGLFELSKKIGVSPWHYMADVTPVHKEEIEIESSLHITSKEPSVKYRGFFINDEFPSFGNWCIEKFGGFTAEMYDKVFELLLRLKGNYLWPAMWVSSFPLDGPGLLNAQLADLYGIVIGNSHHEPCLRASEEWDKVKGADSIYGQDWNYHINREGLLRYWEDGLKRSGKYEGIITVGMRGERDSSMLGDDATLAENIDLLKDIITQQKKLIRKHVNEDLSKVPMMLALYKEVEAYYYGDETTPGLKDWEGLSDITLMLCEDNYGNMRTLPTKEMREYKAGFGMYYHFDYHGGPVSYEWVNSTPLAKVQEQMSEAYEYGIRDIWIVNVGDLKPQELPLSFFMDMAYDFEKYGIESQTTTFDYTRAFAEMNFTGAFKESADDKKEYFSEFSQVPEGNFETKMFELAAEAMEEYTRINGMRRPEALHSDIYHPVHFEENERMCQRANRLMAICKFLRERCTKEMLPAFIELVYYPAVASANLLLMQNYAGMNAFYADAEMSIANEYAGFVEKAIAYDTELIREYHSIREGKWNHMMSSNHVGFVNWNDEGWSFPQCIRLGASKYNSPAIRLQGKAEIIMPNTATSDARVQRVCRIPCTSGNMYIELLAASTEELEYEVIMPKQIPAESVCEGQFINEKDDNSTLVVNEPKGTYCIRKRLEISFLPAKPGKKEKLTVRLGKGEEIDIIFERVSPKLVGHLVERFLQNEYLDSNKKVDKITGTGAFLVLEASEYVYKTEVNGAMYRVLEDYGRVKDSVKVFPVTESFAESAACAHCSPELIYEVQTSESGLYECILYISPTNPLYPGDAQRIGIGTTERMQIITTLPEGFEAGNCHNPQWNRNVLDNIRECRVQIVLSAGVNEIHIAAVDAGVMLQRIVICAPNENVPLSYLGPLELK